jgi:hypothetical protein
MAIHKLATGPITMTVVAVDETEGNFGPQVQFTGDDGTTVYVSLSSATSQLDRNKLNFETAVGQRLHFEQIKKDGKTFTNINRVPAGVGAPATAAAAAPARPAAPALSMPELAALYGQCVDAAVATIGVKLEAAGVPFDGAVIQSAAATLFIKATW